MKIDWTHIIKRLACWILLLQIINISIDPPDLRTSKHHTATREDLSINKIESIYELVAEGICDTDVPESDEDEIDSSSQSFVLYFITRHSIKVPAIDFPIEHFSYYPNNFVSVHQEPNAPPPKFA